MALAVGTVVMAALLYNACVLEVPTGSQAILIRKTGLDLPADQELAPPPGPDGHYFKGVQAGVLTEGRYFYNPFYWDWEIKPQKEVEAGHIGLKISLAGDDLPPDQILAEPGQKGIQRGWLPPGRYPYNWYAETIETQPMVTIPGGFRGVVTSLAGKLPKDPNVPLVGPGERGVQKVTLAPGTYPVNPYETRISVVDCRSKRFNLNQGGELDFLSADGFPITVDGAVEFRVIPERAAEVFVLYNEDDDGDRIDDEIIAKVITPESRSICRINGSKLKGGEFISGIDREQFQQNLVKSLKANCQEQGVEILAVAVTSIRPPQAIAEPVRAREVAKQQLAQYQQEKLQQISEAQLRVQELLADQKKALVEAEQAVVEQTTKAEQEQSVAKTLAEQKLAVAGTNLEAAQDKAAALVAEAQAKADVTRAKNRAELAGLGSRVKAFGGDGSSLAQNILIGKLAPAFRSILSNSDGPLMDLFGQFARPSSTSVRPPSAATAEFPNRPFAGGEALP